MQLQFRQGLVRHQIDTAGSSTFIRKSGNSGDYIDLVCDNAPTIFTLAHGSADYLVEISKSVPQAWGPFVVADQTQWLYWDVSLLDASLTFGFTSLSPYISLSAPNNPTLDQHWFDSTTKMMKVWNGSKWVIKLRCFAAIYINSATLQSYSIGSQVSLNVPCKAGNILLFEGRQPLRDSNGTFLTTESGIVASFTSAQPLRLEAVPLYGEAAEFIPAFSAVRYSSSKKFSLASYNIDQGMVNGIITEPLFPGETSSIVSAGLIRNPAWSFSPLDINKPLYIGFEGAISLTQTTTPTYKVGYVFDADAIIVQLQAITSGGSSNQNFSVSGGVGINAFTVGDVATVSLQPSGVSASTYNNSPIAITPLTIDTYGRVISTGNDIPITPDWSYVLNTPITLSGYGIVDAQPLNSNLTEISHLLSSGFAVKQSDGTWTLDSSTYLTGNELITLSGDITGSGTTLINTALANTGVTPGTYHSVIVNAKGLVIAASNPTTLGEYGIINAYTNVQVDTLLALKANIANTLAGYNISDAYTISQIDSFLANKADINHTHPLNLAVNGINGINASLAGSLLTISLSSSGVVAGTYNSVTVDVYGRITAATNVASQSITISSSNTADITTSIDSNNNITVSLNDTTVTPGTYNSFTVDAKGRITNAANILIPSPLVLSSVDTADIQTEITNGDTITVSLKNTSVLPGTYNTVTVDAKGRITSGSNVSSSSVQYLPDLLDVTVTSPTNGETIVYANSEWLNGYTSKIITDNTVVSTSSSLIEQKVANSSVITTSNSVTNIGVLPELYWFDLFGYTTALLDNQVPFTAKVSTTDSHGNIYVGGSITNPFYVGTINQHAFLVKYSPLGNIIWQKALYGNATLLDAFSQSTISKIIVAPDDSIYVALGDNNLFSIAKINSFGDIVWQSGNQNGATFSEGTTNALITDLCLDSIGNLYVAASKSDTTIFVLKFDPAGSASSIMHIAGVSTPRLAINSLDIPILTCQYYDYDLSQWFSSIGPIDVVSAAYNYSIIDITDRTISDIKIHNDIAYCIVTDPVMLNDFHIVTYDTISHIITNNVVLKDDQNLIGVSGSALYIAADGKLFIAGHLQPADISTNVRVFYALLNTDFTFAWQKVFSHTIDAVTTYDFTSISSTATSLCLAFSVSDAYNSYGVTLKYPVTGSINGTFNDFTIGNSAFSTTTLSTLITSATIILNDPFVGVVDITSEVAHAKELTGVSTLNKLTNDPIYDLNVNSSLSIANNSGLFGEVLTSNGPNTPPHWAPAKRPNAGSMIDVASDSTISVTNSVADAFANLVLGATSYTQLASSQSCTGFGYGVFNYIGANNSAVGGNVAIGVNAMSSAEPYASVAIGSSTLDKSNGGNNIAIGNWAMSNSTTGSYNIAIGDSSMFNTVGDNNVAVGYSSGNSIDSGLNNTLVGTESGYNITTGTNNTVIGYRAAYSTINGTITNSTFLGANTDVTGSNQVQLGDSSTSTYVYGTVQNRSDERDKADIRDTVLGLDFIKQLRPVDFKWNYREDYTEVAQDGTISHLPNDGSKTRNRYHHGVIAQEVKSVIDSSGLDFGGYQDHSVSGGSDVKSIGYDEFVGPLIKAVQQLSSIVESQTLQIAQLQADIEALKNP